MPDTSPVERTRESYDAVAADYAARLADELRGKPLDRALLDAVAELSAGAPVLDVGCGPGHVASYLRGRGAAALATDLSPGMCRAARAAGAAPVFAADMTALPVRDASLAAVVCLYAVIHLDEPARVAAYGGFARTLRPGGRLLLAFHARDRTPGAEVDSGDSKRLTQWWGHDVDLVFRFLEPATETALLDAAGLEVVARLDRAADPAVEHASDRAYLLARRR
jgi:SAM-dependent methyltransferase